MERLYITSTKYSIRERKTKLNGTVYDVYFRVVEPLTLKEKQKKLSGFKTKGEAKKAHDEFILSSCETISRAAVKKVAPIESTIPTVEEAYRKYIADCSKGEENKGSTLYEKQGYYRRFIEPNFAKFKVNDLTKPLLEEWQNKVLETKKSNGNTITVNYVKKVREFFISFLNFVQDRYGYENQLKNVKSPKVRLSETAKKIKSGNNIWSREEFEQFISVVDEIEYKAFFTLLFFTGRRKGEIFALSPKDINKKHRTIVYDKSLTRKTLDGSPYKITSTKEDKVQKIEYCQAVADILDEYDYDKASTFLFGGDKPIAENTLTRAFQRYCKKADVKVIRIHDLRHSFVSMVIHNGATMPVVADLIGDTIEQVLKTYAHMYQSDRLSAIKALD